MLNLLVFMNISSFNLNTLVNISPVAQASMGYDYSHTGLDLNGNAWDVYVCGGGSIECYESGRIALVRN